MPVVSILVQHLLHMNPTSSARYQHNHLDWCFMALWFSKVLAFEVANTRVMHFRSIDSHISLIYSTWLFSMVAYTVHRGNCSTGDMETPRINSKLLRLRQNGLHRANIFNLTFSYKNIWIATMFVSKGPINKKPSLVQIMDRRQTGDKALSEPLMA